MDFQGPEMDIVRREMVDDSRWGDLTSRLQKLLHIPQFVSMWNSLLLLSITKVEDGAIIAGKLLNFNIFLH